MEFQEFKDVMSLESHCDGDHKNAGTFLTEEKTLC